MQLDRTRIAVRERGAVEILDMALHVVRTYFHPILFAALYGAIPFALLNAGLLWGLAGYDIDGDWSNRYVWLMMVLVFLEGPWAMVVVTQFLGAAVFDETISKHQAARETLRSLPALIWCQGIQRGVIPVLGCIGLARYFGEFNWFLEGMLPVIICGAAIILRSFRPFINEIVLLEKSPLRPQKKGPSAGVIPASKRSKYLHEPSGGDLFLRWMGAALVAVLLFLAIQYALITVIGMLLGTWGWGNTMILHFGFPIVMWLVVTFMAVVRFLTYVDLRIRVEGWEVELRLKAEAVRMASKLT